MVRLAPWFPSACRIAANSVAASIQMNGGCATEFRQLRKECVTSIETMETRMQSRDYIFWEVDVQADFMLPGGKLHVPGAEKLLPNIRKLTDAARRGEVFLVSHGCFHLANDPEFKQFPRHCVKGTAGAEFVPEALAANFVRVENDANARLPEDLFKYQQIILEKQTLDIFETQHADELLERLGSAAEFVVFGVVTEYCGSLAVRGLLKR